MDLQGELLEIERELASGDGATYRRHLRDDAHVIVPGQRLDKPTTAAAMDESPGWDSFEIEGATVLPVGEAGALLTYRYGGSRGGEETYAAEMTSVYERDPDGEWKLVLHQQTPLS